ncbi:uncharacterized protein LOC129718390 [Wyeomyia smithii]|uniref:uncharacterized protein LOC129718390 n=1 Tax=Wyeomyia smithii TaxID=174621 RepID=UPI00246820F1|nr:uncharacterized protein LOC129718390 [Wyeomyia smithii]
MRSILLLFTCLYTIQVQGQNNMCEIRNIGEAEKLFFDAFRVSFNKAEMSTEAARIAACIENKSLKLTEIPGCLKPKYCLLCRGAMYALIVSYRSNLAGESPQVTMGTLAKDFVWWPSLRRNIVHDLSIFICLQ